MALAAAQPAGAHTKHHKHILHTASQAAPHVAQADPPSAGFGPTSAGVSSILIDAGNGQVIAQSGADVPRYPASLTKLMVLDLTFQALRSGRMTLDTDIPVSAHAAAAAPVKLGLRPGSTLSARQAILAMTTMSANDAATALGEFLGGGSEVRCAQMMTLRAHALGMAQTSFRNASGLPDPDQVTTARDLSILARDIVVGYPEDQPFFEVTSFDFNGRQVYSNNGMLRSYSGATGMKTGYTNLARHNLITSAERNGRVLIGVTLHEPSWGTTYQDMTAMLDGGFGGHVPMANIAVAANKPVAPHKAASQMASVAPVVRVAGHAKPQYAGSWTAQLGLYSKMSKARVEAIKVAQMRGVGVARVAKVQSHGKTLWTAQLAGLTQTAAHQTCNVLAAQGATCRIIAPTPDHLAMANRDFALE
jgi:D-alanyl-D-alanine carboxypeptidase